MKAKTRFYYVPMQGRVFESTAPILESEIKKMGYTPFVTHNPSAIDKWKHFEKYNVIFNAIDTLKHYGKREKAKHIISKYKTNNGNTKLYIQ